jgi:phosphate transport system permease protein
MINTPDQTAQKVAASLKKRYAKEQRFKLYGLLAVAFGLGFVVFLFSTIIGNSLSAFHQSEINLSVTYSAELLDPDNTHDRAVLEDADYRALLKQSLQALFPEVTERASVRKLVGLVSERAESQLRERLLAHPELLGHSESIWFMADGRVDSYLKGDIDLSLPSDERGFDDEEVGFVKSLQQKHLTRRVFNANFFTTGDSRQPEEAGVLGAVRGSLLTLLVTLVLAFPMGVGAAVYLEEFAPRNRLTDLIEVNINNLAAVPSIVFGLLGLAVFIQMFGLPRSSPLVGGLVLSLMTLPTIIIASRAALKAVPPSIRQAALGIGASPVQTVTHHVLPLAMPGMLTGAIIGMSRALGESAPLLMIGMVAFVADMPQQLSSPATVLPVQVYLWASSPEHAFVAKTSAAILVLLGFLLVMNLAAVIFRNRFESRW